MIILTDYEPHEQINATANSQLKFTRSGDVSWLMFEQPKVPKECQ